MRWKQELIFIIRRLIHRRRAERELDEEIRAHLEMEIERNIADGMSPEEAQTGGAPFFRECRTFERGQPRDMGIRVVGNLLAGPALRRANAAQAQGLHDCGHAHARAGHWREYGCLQRYQCRVDTLAAVC